MALVLTTFSEWFLIVAIILHMYGLWEHRKLAIKSGWLLPFALWTIIVIGMMIPRILSELITLGFLPLGISRIVNSYIFFMNSFLIVWAAKSFQRHIDKWIAVVHRLEKEADEKTIIVTEVQEDVNV